MTDRGVRELRKKLLLATALAAIASPLAVRILSATQSVAQSGTGAPSPVFEVASVKRNATGVERNSMVVGPAGVAYTNVSLRACIRAAYGLQDYQIIGPAWLTSERYDIVAKAAGPASNEQLYAMLRALLSDRFRLKLHRESKELPVFALVLGKNGPKFHESEGSGTPRRRLVGGSLVVEKSPVSYFTEYLARISSIGRPVIDLTGLLGIYDFKINLVEGGEELNGEGPMKLALDRVIFTAVQDQLGLKLEPRKSIVDLLVIEDGQKIPTEN